MEYSDNQGQGEVKVSSVSNLVRDVPLKLTSEVCSLALAVYETLEVPLVTAHLTIKGLLSIYQCCSMVMIKEECSDVKVEDDTVVKDAYL